MIRIGRVGRAERKAMNALGRALDAETIEALSVMYDEEQARAATP